MRRWLPALNLVLLDTIMTASSPRTTYPATACTAALDIAYMTT